MLHLVLAALSSPVPVIVRSMPPEVVKSLPPVAIRSTPGPDMFAALGIVAAVLAALFSGIAIRIAVKTLQKIDEQLGVGNKQLERADRQLSIAEDELRVVSEDLDASREQVALARDQFKELIRRPDLECTLTQVVRPAELETLPGTTTLSRRVDINFAIRNVGTRTARHFLLEYRVPISNILVSPFKPTVDDAGKSFYSFEVRFGDEILYADQDAVTGLFSFTVLPELRKLEVQWRMRDEDILYQKDYQEWKCELEPPPEAREE